LAWSEVSFGSNRSGGSAGCCGGGPPGGGGGGTPVPVQPVSTTSKKTCLFPLGLALLSAHDRYILPPKASRPSYSRKLPEFGAVLPDSSEGLSDTWTLGPTGVMPSLLVAANMLTRRLAASSRASRQA